VSVTVFDRAGVRGASSYWITVDGVRIKASVSYTKRGDYRRFKLSFATARRFAAGTHVVVVGVRNRRGHRSVATWRFVVRPPADEAAASRLKSPEAVVAPSGASDAQESYVGTATIHLSAGPGERIFYQLDASAMLEGDVVVVPPPATGTAQHALRFTIVDSAGNARTPMALTFTVSAEPAAPPTDTLPPVTTSDVRGAYVGTATVTLAATDAATGAVRTFWRLDSGPVNEGCVLVVPEPVEDPSERHLLEFWSVDAAGNEESPHNVVTFLVEADMPIVITPPHPVASGPCVDSGCHVPEVTVIHEHVGCTACHAPGIAPTLECLSCHIAPPPPPPHPVASGPCVDSGCHVPEVTVIHEHVGCTACHAPGIAPTLECLSCHDEEAIAAYHDFLPPVTYSDAEPSYVGTATINLSAMDRSNQPMIQVMGAGVAAIYYRLDDGDLRVEYPPLWSGVDVVVAPPASGVDEHSLQFWSVDLHGNTEVPKTVIFTVEAPAPPFDPITTTSNVRRGYVATATITLTPVGGAPGPSRTFYRLDGGATLEGTRIVVRGPFVEIVYHTLEFWSVDGAGNAESARKTATFYIEANQLMTIPENPYPLTVTSDARSSYVGPATIRLFGSSTAAYIYYRLDGGTVVEGTQVVVGAPLTGSASHTLEVWPANADRVVGRKLTVSFSVAAPPPADLVAPTTISDAVTAYIGSATIRLLATDNPGGSGVAATYWSLDGGPWRTGSIPPCIVPGSHSLRFYSVDVAGNAEAIRSVTFQVAVEPAPPVTVSDFQPQYVGPAVIRLTATGTPGSWPVVATYWRLDGGAWQTGTIIPITAPGMHTLEFYSVDAAGNAEQRKAVTFQVSIP
jgi:hypothetical protein